jgi:hypothetical protein
VSKLVCSTRLVAERFAPRDWRRYNKVEATIVTGGGFFSLKGVLQDRNPRRMTAWLHEERSSFTPYGAPDQRTMFTPDRIAIEKLDGTLFSPAAWVSVHCELGRLARLQLPDVGLVPEKNSTIFGST